MVRFLLRDAVVLTVSLREGLPKAPGMASRCFDRGKLFDVQILQGGERGSFGVNRCRGWTPSSAPTSSSTRDRVLEGFYGSWEEAVSFSCRPERSEGPHLRLPPA
jgi:hypothetical protein